MLSLGLILMLLPIFSQDLHISMHIKTEEQWLHERVVYHFLGVFFL